MKVKVLSRSDIAKFSYSSPEEMKRIFAELKESGTLDCKTINPVEYS
ncbi:MAG: hypothetical protein KGH71_03130 [Candidatus Micrarchaeota archaeon]|nr:hypothetical protein [Candidatus Micrarchaeota archaeon]